MRLYQIGDRMVPMAIFIRYDAFRLYALFAVAFAVAFAVPILGPIAVFATLVAAGCAMALDTRQMIRRWPYLAAAAAGMWWVFYHPWILHWWEAGIYAGLAAWPTTVVALRHLADRTLGGFLALWRSETATWWAHRRARALAPHPTHVRADPRVRHRNPLENP
jgi:hypothetical protein